MKHPALTSALSVALTVLCIVQLFVGIFGFGKAEEDLTADTNAYKRIENRLQRYREVKEELEMNELDYDTASETLVERQEQHNSDASEHRTALSIYTATRSGEIQGADALWEAKAAMAQAWVQMDAAEQAYNEQAAAFYEQYDQFMQIKPVLDAVMPAVNEVIQASAEARGVLASIVEVEGMNDEQYELANNAYVRAVEVINELQNSEYYPFIVERAAEAGIDIAGVLEQAKSYQDEGGNLSREEADRMAREAGSAILDGFDNAVNGLSQVKAIADSEAMIVAGKEAIDQAGEAIAEGRRQLASGEAMIQGSLEYIWYELGKLDKQKLELEEEREELLADSEEIAALQAEVEYYEDLTQRMKGARNFLLYYSDVSDAYEAGMELEEAAQYAIDTKAADAAHKYEVRRIYYYIAIAAAVIGILSMFGAFEKIKIRNFVFVTALICMVMSLGAEYLYRTLDIDSLYITLITPIFAFLQALTVIPQKKKI